MKPRPKGPSNATKLLGFLSPPTHLHLQASPHHRALCRAGTCPPPPPPTPPPWILNVLVDATRHHGETETADQNSGLVDLH